MYSMKMVVKEYLTVPFTQSKACLASNVFCNMRLMGKSPQSLYAVLVSDFHTWPNMVCRQSIKTNRSCRLATETWFLTEILFHVF